MLPIDNFKRLGFTLEDYKKIYKISTAEQDSMHILDCYAGFNSFTAEMEKNNHRVVSIDPMYGNSPEELKAIFAEHKKYLEKSLKDYGLEDSEVAAKLLECKRDIEPFWQDYAKGLEDERYVYATLPELPFEDESFDLVLCSNYIFSDPALTDDMRFDVLMELARIADEIRIFPLLKDGHPAKALGPVLKKLQNENYNSEIKEVAMWDGTKQPMLIIDGVLCNIAAHRRVDI